MKTVAVVAGDELCVQTAARAWVPSSLSRPVRGGVLHLVGSDGNAIAFVSSGVRDGVAWSGGPLIWLVPERGPSQPELAQLRAIASRAPASHEPWILVCVEPEAGAPNQAELLAIERAVQRALPSERSYCIGVVERTRRDSEHSLGRFLVELSRGS